MYRIEIDGSEFRVVDARGNVQASGSKQEVEDWLDRRENYQGHNPQRTSAGRSWWRRLWRTLSFKRR